MENSNELEVVGVGILRTGKNWEITAKRVTSISFLFLNFFTLVSSNIYW